MKWNDFLKRKDEYKTTWDKLKDEYKEPIRKFLDKSYLDIFFNGKQIEFGADAYSIALENPSFFIKDKYFDEYLELVRAYKAVEKFFKSEDKEDAMADLKEFDVSNLSVVPNRPEIVFPTVDIDFIQEVKKSKYCDQDATNMSKASIRIILIGGDKMGYPW